MEVSVEVIWVDFIKIFPVISEVYLFACNISYSVEGWAYSRINKVHNTYCSVLKKIEKINMQ